MQTNRSSTRRSSPRLSMPDSNFTSGQLISGASVAAEIVWYSFVDYQSSRISATTVRGARPRAAEIIAEFASGRVTSNRNESVDGRSFLPISLKQSFSPTTTLRPWKNLFWRSTKAQRAVEPLFLISRDQSKAIAQQEFTQLFPQPGWVEHDPRRNLVDATSDDAASSGRSKNHGRFYRGNWYYQPARNRCRLESGYGQAQFATQSFGRTAARLSSVMSSNPTVYGPLIQEKTGLVIDAYFSGTKLKWILDNVNGARTLADAGKLCFGTVRFVAALETDRWQSPCDRCQQRQPHDVVQYCDLPMG